MLEFVPPGHVIGSGRASICAFVSPMKDTTQLIAHRLLRHHAVLALALALIMTGVSWRWNTRAASGSDAYGYVSEAELWLRGDLQIDQRFARQVPWPDGDYSFTPLGYRPTADGNHIVPTYPPGLPLIMAAAKAVGGQCALYWVVPIMAGVLVFGTYAIGRQMGRPIVGVAAAWLVATSPAVLFMSMWPMSDVPAAATWAVAVAFLISETGWTAAAAGVTACLAVLVRPNLVPLAAILVAWIGWRDVTTARSRDWRRVCTPWFALGALIGMIAVMIIFAKLYGSPFRSGYGDLSDSFAMRWVPRNFRNYRDWLMSTETPLAALGLISLGLPFARVWTTRQARHALWLVASCAAIVWASYLAYQTWDAWWYLRFLLPSWPMMAIGSASVLAACYRVSTRWTRAIAVVTLVLVGAHGVRTAIQRNVFDLARQEAVYVEAARAVEAFAGPDDVIFSQQFSGSIRYYSGRLTFRYNYLDPEWLDRAVQWFNERGHHAYFLLTAEEVWAVRREYASKSRLARLDWTPLMLLRGGEVRLFDTVPRYLTTDPPSFPPTLQARCQRPKPNPTLRTMADTR